MAEREPVGLFFFFFFFFLFKRERGVVFFFHGDICVCEKLAKLE